MIIFFPENNENAELLLASSWRLLENKQIRLLNTASLLALGKWLLLVFIGCLFAFG